MPVTASIVVHLALVAGLFMLPAWTAPRETVLILDLVEPDAPPVPVTPPPATPHPRPLTPPKAIKAPPPTPPPAVDKPAPVERPAEPQRVETPPEPPKPIPSAPPVPPAVAPATPPSLPTSSTAVASESAPSASSSATASAPASQSAFAVSEGPSAPAASSGPAVAAVPSDGITQRAMPRGGYQYRPSYPASARSLGIQGTTLLGILVATDGRVADVVVKESAGHPDLDQAAADAVRRWRFEPARRGSEAVAMWVLLPVEFKLRR